MATEVHSGQVITSPCKGSRVGYRAKTIADWPKPSTVCGGRSLRGGSARTCSALLAFDQGLDWCGWLGASEGENEGDFGENGVFLSSPPNQPRSWNRLRFPPLSRVAGILRLRSTRNDPHIYTDSWCQTVGARMKSKIVVGYD